MSLNLCVNRLTAVQALVSQHTTNVVDANTITSHDDHEEIVCEGVDNLGYERESHRFDGTNRIKTNRRSDISPVLHFPLPPHNRPPSSSSRFFLFTYIYLFNLLNQNLISSIVQHQIYHLYIITNHI